MNDKNNLRTNNIVNQYITTIISVFESVRQIYENNLEIIKQAEGEQCDIEHEIQLTPPKNAREGYKIYKELYDTLTRRRVAKDENEIIEELYNFLNQNKEFKNKLSQIQGNTSRKYEAQLQRKYIPRQRNDLKCTEECSMVFKPFEGALRDFNNNKKKSKIAKG